MATPAGYLYLLQRFNLKTLPLPVESEIARGAVKVQMAAGIERRSYPPRYDPGPNPDDQLEFALKHEPMQLAVLATWFEQHRDEAEAAVASLVKRKPTGEYGRRAWFLYEWLTGRRLDLPDGRPRNFVPLLDDTTHVTRDGSIGKKTSRSSRHHVENNLPGVRGLCPLVRRTTEIDRWLARDFHKSLTQTVAGYDAALFRRAASYLYLKETRASFEIEGESLSESRAERFVALLQQVARAGELGRETLVDWQRELVEPRFATKGWRDEQVYVGDTGRIGRPGRVHYIAPKPGDVSGFIDDLLMLDALLEGTPPLVHAAVVSFAFVYIHPFDDGNGRLHRLLIHNILSRRGLSPSGIVLPVSAVMLDDRRGYDAALESFSKPLMRLLDYERDEDERVTVKGESALHYRYFDATPMVEALGAWLERTVTEDFPAELEWLEAYDRARAAMRRVVDLPEKHARVLLQVLLNNKGHISKAKRAKFAMLTDQELERLAKIVREELLPLKR